MQSRLAGQAEKPDTMFPKCTSWYLKTLYGGGLELLAYPAIHQTAQPCGQPAHLALLALWPSSLTPSDCPAQTIAGPAQQD